MTTEERMQRFVELTRQMKADPEVLAIVENFKQRNQTDSIGLLAQDFPEEFDLMCLAIDDLLEQAPTEMSPWWT